MNESFHKANGGAAGRWNRFWLAAQSGGLGALRMFRLASGMKTTLKAARQKRTLESRMQAAGFTRRLAKIAAREAFRPPAQSD